MNGRWKTPSARRVVLWVPKGTLDKGTMEDLGPALECFSAASAYEAAAELLTGPVEAVILDWRCLKPSHVRLIEIARQRGTKVLTLGAPPAWVSREQLGDIHQTGQEQLAEAIRALAARAPAEARPSTAPGKEAPPPAKVQAKPAATGGPTKLAASPGPVDQAGTYETQKKAPEGNEPLLTPEELDALLGDVK